MKRHANNPCEKSRDAKRRNQNIYIPFRIYIPAGGSQFTIPLERHLLKEEYEFHFDTLLLMPDLYSKQAQTRDYDPPMENEFEHSYPFHLEFNYGPKYYSAEGDAHKYVQNPSSEVDLSTTLIGINKFFEGKKAVGQKWPPVIVDWAMLPAILSGKDANQYTRDSLYVTYQTKTDDPSLHDWLPSGSRMPGLNNYQFPTGDMDPMVYKLLRVRLHLAPNVEIGFSNEYLLKAFGFSIKQYNPKSAPNAQIKFFNSDPQNYLTIVGGGPPGTLSPSNLNKISLYAHKKKLRSPDGVLTTKRGHLVKPDQLAEDYNRGFSSMAEKCLHSLSLSYTSATKKFKFTYPATEGLTTDIYLDPEVAEQLGYPRGTYKITQATEPSPVENTVDHISLYREMRTITYDVGLATVYHQDEIDYSHCQFADKVMANLYPTDDGILEMRCQSTIGPPTAYLSYFALPQLNFTVKRFSEASEPVPLCLPTGSYMIGHLVGEKV